MVKLGSL